MTKGWKVSKNLDYGKMTALKMGDTFPLGKLFPGVTNDTVLWELVERSPSEDGEHYFFDTRYCDIFTGQVELILADNKVYAKEV